MTRPNINASYPTCDPGDFRHLITLLEPTTGTDESGTTVSYEPGTPPITAFAKIDYLRGTEMIKAGQDVSQTYLKITAWYRPEFSATSRIRTASGSHYRIQAVENVHEMSVFMVLTCLGIGTND